MPDTASTAPNTATVSRTTDGTVYRFSKTADLSASGYTSRFAFTRHGLKSTFVPADKYNAATACDTSKFQLYPSEYKRFTGDSAVPPSMGDWKVKGVSLDGDIADFAGGEVDDEARKLARRDKMFQWHFERSTAESPSDNNENAEPAT
jgi:hypothetical protein